MVTDIGSSAAQPKFSVLRSFKIGTFHIGSSLTDVMLGGVWNRVMISDLGLVAWPVSLLLAARYFLAPLAIWAGHQSDTHPILGSRRTAYIWLGRLMMLVSLPLLPLSVGMIAQGTMAAWGWVAATLSLVLYGTGTSISGAPYLALVHDSAPYQRRGQAVSITQFMLVVSFAFVPLIYARVMPAYDQALFWRLVIVGMAGATLFWLISVIGEERRAQRMRDQGRAEVETTSDQPPLEATLRDIWSHVTSRRYAIFLGVSAFFAFMQDAVLEPFGGDVFQLPAGQTTRFNAYWGVGVLISMIITYVVTRKRRPDQQVATTAWGLALLGIPLLLLAVSAFQESLAMVVPVLVLFGLGFGVFTVGGVSLLMAMTTAQQAASYLALWSVIQLISRGLGIAAGGLVRDVVNTLTGDIGAAYGAVFALEAIGLFACIWLLMRVDIPGFAVLHRSDSPDDGLIAALE